VRLHRSAATLALLLTAAGCRHALPPAPLPTDWQVLVAEPRPFEAIYRLSCCGYRDLVLAVRADGERLSLSVAVPPGGTAMAAWIEGEGGWVHRVKQHCREPLPKGVLPVSARAALPLNADLATLLLSGLLPEGAHELPGMPGWVEATGDGFLWRARVEGPGPHCTQVVVTRPGEQKLVLRADLEAPRKVVPGVVPVPRTLSLVAGSVNAKLILEAWRVSDAPSPPGWLSVPVCGGDS
jgi:hypothetical protein